MDTAVSVGAYIRISAAAGVSLTIHAPSISITSRLSSCIAGCIIDCQYQSFGMRATIGIGAYIRISAAGAIRLTIDSPEIAITSRLSSGIAGCGANG